MPLEVVLTEISGTLRIIQWSLILINCLLLLSFIRLLLQMAAALRKLVYREQNEDDFTNRINDLMERGELDKAIAHSERRLSAKGNSRYALWFLAVLHYEKEHWQEAIEYGERLRAVAPYWKEEIKEIMDSAKAKLSKPVD